LYQFQGIIEVESQSNELFQNLRLQRLKEVREQEKLKSIENNVKYRNLIQNAKNKKEIQRRDFKSMNKNINLENLKYQWNEILLSLGSISLIFLLRPFVSIFVRRDDKLIEEPSVVC
jgi:CRISPR/Cas system CSM-associated protein Csm2 small subunit